MTSSSGRWATGRRRDQLDRWLADDLPERFAGRVLPVDAAVAERWGALRASGARAGRTLPVVESLIAATAVGHGLAVVTRKVRDFRDVGVRLVDPWADPT